LPRGINKNKSSLLKTPRPFLSAKLAQLYWQARLSMKFSYTYFDRVSLKYINKVIEKTKSREHLDENELSVLERFLKRPQPSGVSCHGARHAHGWSRHSKLKRKYRTSNKKQSTLTDVSRFDEFTVAPFRQPGKTRKTVPRAAKNHSRSQHAHHLPNAGRNAVPKGVYKREYAHDAGDRNKFQMHSD
jgi:hypothetical protein